MEQNKKFDFNYAKEGGELNEQRYGVPDNKVDTKSIFTNLCSGQVRGRLSYDLGKRGGAHSTQYVKWDLRLWVDSLKLENFIQVRIQGG